MIFSYFYLLTFILVLIPGSGTGYFLNGSHAVHLAIILFGRLYDQDIDKGNVSSNQSGLSITT